MGDITSTDICVTSCNGAALNDIRSIDRDKMRSTLEKGIRRAAVASRSHPGSHY